MMTNMGRWARAVPRLFRDRRGQLAIPSLFVIPSLFLFVYLIFETAKISREKIRHQFAVDAASFIEMTNYSDFLNRSAYVNGAFPQRIFHEGFYGTCIEKKNNTQGDCGTQGDRLYNILYKNGTYPRWEGQSQTEALDPYPQWMLRFDDSKFSGKNQVRPNIDSRLDIITMQDALDYWISWDDAQDIYKLYVQIYQLLGSVEDAQYSVFKRLTSDHNFYRKSYWLNTNDPINDGQDGASWFNVFGRVGSQFAPKPYCVEEVMIYGNKPTNNAFQPYQIWAPNNPITMPNTITGCTGLFQVESIDTSQLTSMRTPKAPAPHPGYSIFQHWDRNKGTLSRNYFKVDFHQSVRCKIGGGPCVHASIALAGGHLWPNPTPKFQTRLFP